MKHAYTMITAGGFALATAIAANISHAEADAKIASNSQLKGQYAWHQVGRLPDIVRRFRRKQSAQGPDENLQQPVHYRCRIHFRWLWQGNANFLTVVTIIVPGPNPTPIPSVGLSTGGGNFTYTVGPKNTVTVTLKDPVFKNLNGPSAGQSSMIDEVVLEGHFGPDGLTLVKTDGAVEILTPPTGSPFPRICGRSFVLLNDRPRF